MYNEEHDTPNDPGPYGIMGWHEGDSAVYVYDKYDVWKIYPAGNLAPKNITTTGRLTKNVYRYTKVNPEERFLSHAQPVFFRTQNKTTKEAGIKKGNLAEKFTLTDLVALDKINYGTLVKADKANAFIYTKETYTASPDLFFTTGNYVPGNHSSVNMKFNDQRLSATNPQQAAYNWGTAELFKWKAFNGKTSEGILYKPEDFDPAKKYPMIIYFYEKVSDGLYNYIAPSPTPSRLNIPFYVSRGYLVFAPDISYTQGGTGQAKMRTIIL